MKRKPAGCWIVWRRTLLETLNTLAASYVYAGDYERAIELLQTVDLPQARYNLGLLKAKQCKLDEAYALLAPYADLNAAICALRSSRTQKHRTSWLK